MDSVLPVVFFVLFFPVMWAGVIALIAQLSGWRRLAGVYASNEPPGLDKRHMCSLRIGRNAVNGARYNGVMTIGVNGDGIWFDITVSGVPGLHLRVSEAVGRWIEDTAMARRGT